MGRMADSQASFLQHPETKVDIQGGPQGTTRGYAWFDCLKVG